MIKKLLSFVCLITLIAVFFWQFFLKGLLPIPSDTIIGLYHPFRDLYSKSYPNGIPFKNFLITDPVRQEIPWKEISINSLKSLSIPSWNPYSFSGTPNIANLQSGVFYPLNIVFFVLPFAQAWSIFIMLQPFLGGIFMFLFLRNRKLSEFSSFFGAFVFAFSGFFTTWLEWGNVLSTALWLPLILFSVDKLINVSKRESLIRWGIVFAFSLASSLFAGHLQTFLYVSILAFAYFLFRWFESGRETKNLKFFGIFLIVFAVLTAVQWLPTLRFIALSARSLDQNYLTTAGWFLPWQNLVQFTVPDFFGNPSTLNYWGVWNYGELTGYIGILPIVMALFAIFYKRSKETLFFAGVILISLLFALPNPISKLPFSLNVPFISSAQPTRLLLLLDFSLAFLAAIGFEKFSKEKRLKEIILPIGIIATVFVLAFAFTQLGLKSGISTQDLLVAKRNIFLPVAIFIISAVGLLLLPKLSSKYSKYLLIFLIILTVFDLFRFSWKFNAFTKREYLFPDTKSLTFIKNNIDEFRIATTDPTILPPNFSAVYGIPSVEGYDPLFTMRYAQFISAINRNKPNIAPPFGFNRIVRIENFDSDLVDLLGVKYVLSLSNLTNPKFEKVFEEGQTKVYENTNVFPRAFIVQNVLSSKGVQDSINKMFESGFDPINSAVVEGFGQEKYQAQGSVEIENYEENRVEIGTDTDAPSFLVLTDTYYPSWHAKIDGKPAKIYLTDFDFRGVELPKGKHSIVFYNGIL